MERNYRLADRQTSGNRRNWRLADVRSSGGWLTSRNSGIFRKWQEDQRSSRGRSADELQFVGVYGCCPGSLGGELRQRQELTVAGMRIVITAERLA
jgi:hypothetical protein